MGIGAVERATLPSGARTRVSTGTNADDSFLGWSSSERTMVTWVAEGSSSSALSATASSTCSRSVARPMRFCAAYSLDRTLGSASRRLTLGIASSFVIVRTWLSSPSSAMVTLSVVTASPLPSSMTSPDSRSAVGDSALIRTRSSRRTRVVPLVEPRSVTTTRSPSRATLQ
jgi:hypothetical protein